MSVGLEIHDAASTGDQDSLEEYLRSGKFDVNTKDEEWHNRTALHWACSKGYVECVRLLIEYGAFGTARTDTGWTPAHFAAETGKLTALRALYNANIAIGLKDKYGDTPRRIAEIYGHTECIKFIDQCPNLGSECPTPNRLSPHLGRLTPMFLRHKRHSRLSIGSPCSSRPNSRPSSRPSSPVSPSSHNAEHRKRSVNLTYRSGVSEQNLKGVNNDEEFIVPAEPETASRET